MASVDIDGLSVDAYRSFQAREIANANIDKLKNNLTATGQNKDATDEELMDACKQFEAYFLEQIFKQMYKSVEAINGESTDPQASLVSYFRDSTISDIASTSVDTQSNGLAQMLYESMKRTIDSVDPRTIV